MRLKDRKVVTQGACPDTNFVLDVVVLPRSVRCELLNCAVLRSG
jgi:hypothetical protein